MLFFSGAYEYRGYLIFHFDGSKADGQSDSSDDVVAMGDGTPGHLCWFAFSRDVVWVSVCMLDVFKAGLSLL